MTAITARSVIALIDAARNAGQNQVVLAMANDPRAKAAKATAARLWDDAAAANKILGNGKQLSFNDLLTLASGELVK
jgi:hypothetical protein